ncbi:peptidase family M1-domain-containing protein [Trichophaea hybrida]|nr:peptidase family M1-domain-containing protein [Trichophaea hybrida]
MEGESGSVNITQGREVLPTNVKPLHYDLKLEPNFKDFTFEGTVSIELEIKEASTEISVNTLEINIKDTKLEHCGKTLTPVSHNYNEDTQTDKFAFGEELPAGSKATLTIKYVGQLNDKMAGFYRSSYVENGVTKYMATTQMEPTDARRAAPCFDQPDLKSTWTVTLIADKELTCLSNMDVKDEKDVGNGKKSVTFNKTPLMSTYLLAFIVGDLRYKETNAFRLPIRVYATPGNEQYADFSLDIAARTLAFYEKEFGVDYPLPKMDMVAIPDFSAGAMENWGLVTYRIVDLLYDPKTASVDRKQRIAEVVQHELAHQWFGNLVTMDFWEGLWLNEGFATWMSWYSMNEFYPNWKVWENYVVDNLAAALNLDGLRSSHPIEVPVKRVAEINQIFDSISYAKGSSILRMVSKYLGEDVFMKGVKAYLKKHAYGNTKTTDLWAALSEASGKNVEEAMATWTKKIGYPVVTVTENGNKLHLKQNRYLKTADVKPEEDETLWPIFVGLRTKGGINEDISFNTREFAIEVENPDFFKINADQSAVYRTLYSPERLKKLGEAAKSGLLSVEDRAGLLGDAGALATSGYQKTSALLDLVAGFKQEKSYVVWAEIASRIGSIKGTWMFAPQEERTALRQFQRELMSPLAHQLGWVFTETDDELTQQLKSLAFSGAGLNGDPKVIEAALAMFKKFAEGDLDAIHPNLRGTVYGIALENGENQGEKEWDVVYDAFKNGRNNDEKNVALRWLGRSKNPENIKKTLALTLSSEVKDQDIYQPISGVRSHREGSEALWAWFKENYDLLIKKLPPGLSMLGSVVSMCTSNFTSNEQALEVHDFFKDKDTKGFDRALAQSMDTIAAKASWLSRDKEDVQNWLKVNGYLNNDYQNKL